jgi:hypothetical protein
MARLSLVLNDDIPKGPKKAAAKAAKAKAAKPKTKAQSHCQDQRPPRPPND